MKKLSIISLLAVICLSFTHKPLTWVAIGDSITYMNEHPDETNNRITKGYETLVTEKLPYIHYVNQGHNGWTSGGIAQQIDSLGIQKADIYSIFLGTNDWWGGRPLGTMADYENNTGNNTIYGSFRIIINKLRGLNSEAAIILITPMQRTDFVYVKSKTNNAYGSYKPKNDQTLEQVVKAVQDIGTYEKLQVLDLYHQHGMDIPHLVKYKRLKDPQTGEYKNYSYPDYIGIPFNPQTDDYPYPVNAANITFDGLHPSDKGYKIIANKLVHIMKQY